MTSGADGLASLSVAACVLALGLWLGLAALRRLRPNGLDRRLDDCRIVHSLAVGPRERIVVVAIGPRQLVIGVGGGAVSLLCELDEPLSAPAAVGVLGEAVRQTAARWRQR